MKTPTPQRKRALTYLRVSSAGQVNNDYDPEGISLPAQREAAHRRADQLDADIVDEYLEPGRSATTTDGRPEFQRMMARIKAEKDVDYIIVYARSRLHRNSVDAAITKRDLRDAGVVLISVMDYTEDSAIGDLVATVLDGVNEYQSRAAGADISYKMGQKVKRGGSVGKAPIGYLNVRENFEGREVRTVVLDPERAPLVRMAFELYATGIYGFHALIELLTNAGLRTKPTKRNPAGIPISINKLGLMLRDCYYLGKVTHQGIEYPGRHEALVTQEIFDRTQTVLETRRLGGVRERQHNHYLKGTVWCHRCRRRLIISRAKNKQGVLYFLLPLPRETGQNLRSPPPPRPSGRGRSTRSLRHAPHPSAYPGHDSGQDGRSAWSASEPSRRATTAAEGQDRETR
jgi:DNA invertase Pin-like site-specific DNA recombinase